FAIAAIIQVAEHGKLRAEILLPFAALRTDAAERHGRQQHTLGRLEIGDVVTHGDDVAGNIAAVDVRQLDSRKPLADKQIEVVQSAGLYLHHHLVVTQRGVRDIFILQYFRTTKLVKADGFHQGLLVRRQTCEGIKNSPRGTEAGRIW